MFPWLTVLAVLPLAGAIVITIAKQASARLIGLATSLAALVVGVVVLVLRLGGTELAERFSWLPALGSSYALSVRGGYVTTITEPPGIVYPAQISGFGGVGLAMALLTVVLVPLVLIAEWRQRSGEDGRWGAKGFVGLVLLVESFSLFAFLADDLLLFYVFFEATLIPMYFLIGGGNGAKRTKAATKFLLFGLAGGLIMLFGVIGVGALTADIGAVSFGFDDIAALGASTPWVGRVIFLAFFIAFALKAPMVPGHTWLPDAAEASTPGGAALMVGILDKLGTFGMIRVCLWVFPVESNWAAPVLLILALISIFYGALAAIASKNLMRLVAFTSISHFGFMVLGVFAFTTQSLTGAMVLMVSHGLATGALYLLLGFLIARRGSANVNDYGGVVKLAPLLAGFTLVAGLASLALPGTANFISEFLVVAGTWGRHHVIAGIALLGTVLAALYILWLYQRLMTGKPPDEVERHVTSDLNWRERLAVIPLIALLLIFGFYPKPVLDLVADTSGVAMGAMTHAGVTDPSVVTEGK